MSEENDKQTNGIILGAITWMAILLVLMILIYKDCRSTQDNIQNCIKAGKDPKDCACSFDSRAAYRTCGHHAD